MATAAQLQKRLNDKKAKVEKLSAQLKAEKEQLAEIKNQIRECKSSCVSKAPKPASKAKAVKKSRSSKKK